MKLDCDLSTRLCEAVSRNQPAFHQMLTGKADWQALLHPMCADMAKPQVTGYAPHGSKMP
eukprot:2136941-Amphidinium_carterae.1